MRRTKDWCGEHLQPCSDAQAKQALGQRTSHASVAPDSKVIFMTTMFVSGTGSGNAGEFSDKDRIALETVLRNTGCACAFSLAHWGCLVLFFAGWSGPPPPSSEGPRS